VTAYERLYRSPGRSVTSASFSGPLAQQIQFNRVLCRQGGAVVSELNPQREVEVEVHYFAVRPFPTFEMNIALFRDGIHITSCYDTVDEAPLRAGHFVSRFKIPANIFKPGIYTLGIGARVPNAPLWAWGSDVAALDFPESLAEGPAHRNMGVVGIPYTAQRNEQNILA
jgi:hypothetical protein